MYQSLDDKQKKQIFVLVVGILGILIAFLAVKTINAIRESGYIGKGVYAANIITVSGKGEVMAVPDVASFSFSVTENAKTMKDAQDQSAKKMNSAIEAIKAMGVDEKDIKTTSYSSYPKYEYNNYPCAEPTTVSSGMGMMAVSSISPCRTSKSVLVGYEVSQTVLVKVRKTDTAGDILTKVGTLGVDNISGLSFVVDDPEKVQAQARDMAIKDAQEKAKELSKSLGVKFVRITSFYDNNNTPIYGYGGTGLEAKTMSAVDIAVPQLPTGENKIVSNVTISYEIK